jgi:hypothetical protein
MSRNTCDGILAAVIFRDWDENACIGLVWCYFVDYSGPRLEEDKSGQTKGEWSSAGR